MTTLRSGRAPAIMADARTSVSIPLRGTSLDTLTTVGASGWRCSRLRASIRSAAELGWNRSTSTPGGITNAGSGRPRARSHSRAEVAPGRDHPRRPGQHRPQQPSRARETAGNGDFGAVHDHCVGVVEAGSDQSGRKGGIDHHQVDVVAMGQAPHPPGEVRPRQQPRFAGPGHREGLGRVERVRALVRGVCTTTSSGGSRRHSSHR